MNRFNLFLQVTRARTLPVMIAPVAIGSLLAWAQGTPFHWGLFLVTLLGAISAHLAANVTNDVFDFKAGTDQAAQGMVGEGATFVTGSQPLINGQLSPGHYRTGTFSPVFAVRSGPDLFSSLVFSFRRGWLSPGLFLRRATFTVGLRGTRHRRTGYFFLLWPASTCWLVLCTGRRRDVDRFAGRIACRALHHSRALFSSLSALAGRYSGREDNAGCGAGGAESPSCWRSVTAPDRGDLFP